MSSLKSLSIAILTSLSEMSTLTDTNMKDFFTDSEWDLIYNLVSNNREFCEDDEYDPVSDYNSILTKINTLFN
jgi:hypothetical protein